MKKGLITGVVLGLCLHSGAAQAISIDVNLITFPLVSGANIEIGISGLGNTAPPTLGAYDLTLQFDSTVLTLERVIFDVGGLGGPDVRTFDVDSTGTFVPDLTGAGDSITGGSLLAAGEVNIFEVSLLEANTATCIFCIPPFLDDFQPSSFRLSTLVYSFASSATTEMQVEEAFNNDQKTVLTINGLSDAFGNPLTADVNKLLPIPSTIFLFGIGLIGLGWARRKLR